MSEKPAVSNVWGNVDRYREQQASGPNIPVAWWDEVEFMPVGELYGYQTNWAAQAIGIHAARLGLTLFENSIEGDLKGSWETFLSRIHDLGGREIKVCPNWSLREEEPSGVRVRAEDEPTTLYEDEEGVQIDFVWPFGLINVCNGPDGFNCRIVQTDEALFNQLKALVEEFVEPKTSEGRVYVLVATNKGVQLSSIGVAGVPFEEGNYTPDIAALFKHVVEDLNLHDPCGRLIILDGEPGTGKTYMVRSIVGAVPKAVFVFLPSGILERVVDPGFINVLLEAKRNGAGGPIVLIIEDADFYLMKRDGGNNSPVSVLLNLGNGILGDMIDVRVVCTTNLDMKRGDLDEAITRDMRLCRQLNIGALNPEQASAVYKRLTGKDFDFKKDFVTLAQVYRAARDGGWVPPQDRHRPVGFNIEEVDELDGDSDLEEILEAIQAGEIAGGPESEGRVLTKASSQGWAWCGGLNGHPERVKLRMPK